jgi:hypothetical protein
MKKLTKMSKQTRLCDIAHRYLANISAPAPGRPRPPRSACHPRATPGPRGRVPPSLPGRSGPSLTPSAPSSPPEVLYAISRERRPPTDGRRCLSASVGGRTTLRLRSGSGTTLPRRAFQSPAPPPCSI